MRHQSKWLSVFFMLFAHLTIAQIAHPSIHRSIGNPPAITPVKNQGLSKSLNDTLTTHYSEDFSNGFSGSGNNGPWTFSGEHGELWFTTFPLGMPNGYDPSMALENVSSLYEDLIPNFYTPNLSITSSTADNGFAMIDLDRYNSTTEEGEEPSSTNFLEESIEATLTSPELDLTGIESAELSFDQSLRLCCSGYFVEVQISTNGGSQWTGYDMFSPYGGANEFIQESITINITSLLTEAEDLSSVYIRFVINGDASHYFWMLDDIKITPLPANNLVAGETWYNDYPLYNPDENSGSTFLNYYRNMEYLEMPVHSIHPLDLGIEVTNNGYAAQHNVKLEAAIHFPNGNTIMAYSDPVVIEPSVTDTLWIYDVDLTAFNEFSSGNYTIDYTITQLEPDYKPLDNFGLEKSFSITGEGFNESTIRNDGNTFDSWYSNGDAERIYGVPYTFADAEDGTVEITHIETVFANENDPILTDPGSVVYFNVRIGSVLETDETTSVVFDSENPLSYEDLNLEYVIQEEDIWETETGMPFNWVSFELPEPITVDANSIYQAEIRIPYSGSTVILPATANSEQFSAVTYNAFSNNWQYLGTNSIPLRFRTSQNCPETATIVEEACASFIFQGTTYTESGSYQQTGTTYEGCEILYTLELSINEGENTSSEIEIASCNSGIYNGETYYETGVYTQTIPNSQGCDSLISINYTLLEPTFHCVYLSDCEQVEYDGVVYEENTNMELLLTNAAGCDSIVQVMIEILGTADPTIIEIENCEPYTLNDITYTESGLYTLEYTDINGCDSIVELSLQINNLDNSVLVSNNILIANQEDVSYQWYFCLADNYEPIDGATSQVFIPEENGTYVVQVSQDNCSEYSDCISVIVTSSHLVDHSGNVTVFPNPTRNFISLRASGLEDGLYTLKISSDTGQEVKQKQIRAVNGRIETQINLENLSAGNYMLTMQKENYLRIFKVQKY